MDSFQYPDTAFDIQPQQDVGVYPTLRDVTSFVKGEVPTENAPIEFNSTVDSTHHVVAKENMAMDVSAFDNATRNGDTSLAAMYGETIRQRLERNAQGDISMREKLLEISQAAAEKYATMLPKVVLNNSPEKIATAVDDASKTLTSSISMEKRLEDARTMSGWAGFVWSSILPFYGTAANIEVGNIAKKYTGVGNLDTNASEDIYNLGKKYKSFLTVEEKTKFIEDLWTDLTTSKSISAFGNVGASLIVQQVMAGEEPSTLEKVFDKLNKVLPILDAAGVGLALRSTAHALTVAKEMNSLERAAAKVGGKDVIVGKEAMKIAAQGVGETVKEITGVNAIESLAHLASSTVKNILPSGVSTAPTRIQDAIKMKVEKVLSDLESTLGATGKTIDEVTDIRKVYSPAVNPEVARLDFEGDVARVWFKPAGDASSFTTKEAADEWVKLNDPSGKLGLKVVPDTVNPGFLVNAERKKSLETSIALKEAQLAEEVAKQKVPKKGSKTAAVAKTEAVQGGGSLAPDGSVVAPLKNNVDSEARSIYQNIEGAKLPGQAAEGDVVIYKADGMDRWTTDEASARKTAVDNKAQLRAIAIPKNTFETHPYFNGGNKTTLPTPQGMAGLSKPQHYFYATPYLESVKEVPGTKGGVLVSENVPSGISAFVSKLHSSLFEEGQKQLIILTRKDLGKYNKEWDWQAKHSMGYAKQYESEAHAFYLNNTTDDYSVIVLDRFVGEEGKQGNLAAIFAHEYAHHFQALWGRKYNKELKVMFEDWLASKGKTRLDTADLNILDLMEYRSAYDIITLNKYLKHGWSPATTLFDSDPRMAAWLADYQEFFAENFSKWAFTSEVPTTLLGQTFQKMVEGVRSIFAKIVEQFPAIEITNKRISKLMDDHVRMMKEKGINAPGIFPSSEPHLARMSRTDKLVQDLADMRAELAAINDAETGLSSGWLVEGALPVRKPMYSRDDLESIVRVNLGDWALGTSSEQYADRLIGTFQEGRYKKLLTDFVRKPLEALSRQERANVESVLKQGDINGVEYVGTDLLGMGLNEKEMEAYFTFRAARNLTYKLRNDAVAKSLTGWGYKSIEGGNVPSHTFGRLARENYAGFAIDVTDGKNVRVGIEWQKQNSGKQVYELAHPVEINGKETWYIAVDSSVIRENDISHVIPYRTGEYSRKYTDPYFVKIESSAYTNKDGSLRPKAHRTATTKQDGEKYVAAYNEALRLRNAGQLTEAKAATLMEPYGWNAADFMEHMSKVPEDAKATVLYTRTEDDYIDNTLSFNMGFGKERGDEAIRNVFGEVKSLSPLDSLSSEISNTAFVASVSEWRDNHIKLWYNSFYHTFTPSLKEMDPVQAFYTVINNNKVYSGTDHTLLARQRVEDYLKQQLRMPTWEERKIMGMGRMMAEFVEGKTTKLPEFVGAALRNTRDWPKFARTISFHSYFGFNPVQLLVQGLNAFNAMAVSPVHGLKSAQVAGLYRIALMSDRPEIWRQIAKVNKIATLGLGMNEEEFVLTVGSIRRSGLLDGINSTSLYGDETGKLGLFNKPMRTLGAGSAWFFNRGEEVSRLVSFDIARREWKAANPDKPFFMEDAMRAIIERQDDLTQNMTVANTAHWQKGITSIPLQFVQYQVKLMMNVISSIGGNSRAFTRQEAARLLFFHLLAYGTAGSWLGDWTREVLGKNVNTDSWTEEQRLYVQQGVVAGVINTASMAFSGEPTRLALGTRFNTFKFYEDFINGIFDPQKNWFEVFSGASGGSIVRAADGWSRGLSLYLRQPLSYDAFEEGAKLILTSSLSAANNYNKAIIAGAYDSVLSKNGTQQFAVSKREQFFMKWGITPAAQEDMSVLYKGAKERADLIKKESEEISRLRQMALIALKDGDTKKHDMYSAAANIRLQGLPSESMRQEVFKASLKVQGITKEKQMLMDLMYKQFEPPKDVLVTTDGKGVR
jgi:hypothetical protein